MATTVLPARTCTAFRGDVLIAAGPLVDVARVVKAAMDAEPQACFRTFDDVTGRVIDVDLRGDAAEIAALLADPPPGRGRPKLGVVAREVTLLPRHWEWLARQRGGASAMLRRLVEAARRDDAGRSAAQQARAAAYAFLVVMAGDRKGFESATRALFAGDRARFAEAACDWPADVRDHAARLLDTAAPPAESAVNPP